MQSMQKRSPFSYISGYSKNAVIQLIMACGTVFVTYQLLWAIMRLTNVSESDFVYMIRSNVSLYTLSIFKAKFWTILTYGWLHNRFWELVTNMLWLYCFGNLVQILVGYKQVIPIFLFSIISGGVFYMLCQLIPGEAFQPHFDLMGSQAGLMGLMAASVTLAPTYRFFIGDRLRVHILVVAGIFLLLMLMNSQFNIPQLFLLAGGGLTGFVYIKLLKSGYRPGEWIYSGLGNLSNTLVPDDATLKERKNKKYRLEQMRKEAQYQVTQKRIDDILDKINQKGYNSLTAEEKEILNNAGKEQ